MNTIFVVFATVGCCDEQMIIPLQAFPDKRQADWFCTRKQRRTDSFVGMNRAKNVLIDSFRSLNPLPEIPGNYDTGSPAFSAVEAEHARILALWDAEEERIVKLFDLEKIFLEIFPDGKASMEIIEDDGGCIFSVMEVPYTT
jgi:hypothetical protein